MLWVLLALYLFGSSGMSDHFAYLERIRTFCKNEVTDSGRRDDLLAIVESTEKMIKEQIAERGRIVKELANISERYESKPQDVEPILQRYRALAEMYQAQMIRHRFALKAKMTREEWAKVFPAETGTPAP